MDAVRLRALPKGSRNQAPAEHMVTSQRHGHIQRPRPRKRREDACDAFRQEPICPATVLWLAACLYALSTQD
jgi:hypothetical protein